MGPNYIINAGCATSNHCILSAAGHIADGITVSHSFLHLLFVTNNLDFFSHIHIFYESDRVYDKFI